MDSLKELFKLKWPSSSHTMGPERAAKKFNIKNQMQLNFQLSYMDHLHLQEKGI